MRKRLCNPKRTHMVNSWLSLIISTLIFAFVAIGVVNNLLAEPNEIVQEVGIKTFRMFTVLSNIFMALTAAFSIPFAIDGIRDKNYHLPRWIVDLTFMGSTSVMLTFVISISLLAPRAGFVRMMVQNGNIFLHTLVPILAIILFTFVNDYHTVKLNRTFVALIPIFIYELLYLIFAIFIGEENGGWRDHYALEELMPWYVLMFLILGLSFGLATILRVVHNRMHRQDKILTEYYYRHAKEYDKESIEDAIIALSKEYKKYDSKGELLVPRRIIKILDKKYRSGKSLAYLCNVYVNEHLKDE
ncbi:MAG: hypothetical protein IKC71_01865 [Clostridia bacterium]|nr:hypothetical protein [Clostridia bacterium]MBR2870495.1 hypothetical protein [Clostridia bacterium]